MMISERHWVKANSAFPLFFEKPDLDCSCVQTLSNKVTINHKRKTHLLESCNLQVRNIQ